MNQVTAIVLLVCSWLAIPADASACVCAPPPPGTSPSEFARQVRQQMGEALAVFVGEPVAWNQLTYRFRVQSVWKGDLGPEVVMSSGNEPTADGLVRGSSCNFGFRVGQTYLVFAYGTTHLQMKAHSCTFTTSIEHSQVSLSMLDAIAPRRQPAASIPADQVVAVVGSVRKPGLIRWRAGMTVAMAIEEAGGAVAPVRADFSGLKPKVFRGREDGQEYEALPTTVLLPDDQLFVAGPTSFGTRAIRPPA